MSNHCNNVASEYKVPEDCLPHWRPAWNLKVVHTLCFINKPAKTTNYIYMYMVNSQVRGEQWETFGLKYMYTYFLLILSKKK